MIDSTSAFPARVRRRWAGNAVRGRILVPVLPFVLTVATAAASPNAAVPCGTFVANWIRPADGTSPPGFSPYGVAVDRRGDVYVADDATSRIAPCVPRITRRIARRKRGSDTARIKQTSRRPSPGSASGAKR